MSKTLRTRKNGTRVYEIRVSRGRDPVTGKQLTPYSMTWQVPDNYSKKVAEREASKIEGEFVAKCKSGLILTKQEEKERRLQEALEGIKQPTFSQYMETFIEQIGRSRSENTMLSYKRVLGRANKVWGEYKLSDISKSMVKTYITELQDCYKYKSVCLHFDLLRNMFRVAAEDEIILYSPMQTMKKPIRSKDTQPEENNKAYTEEEIQYIMQCMEQEKLEYKALVYFMADSGCRRGEVCGLTWECVNLKTGEVEIKYNAQYFPREGVKILTPKSGKERKIILNPVALRIMQTWRREQIEWCFKQGIPVCQYCFNNTTGGVMNPATLTSVFRVWGEKYDIDNFHPHKLRLSMATISIANGADVVSVSKKLGHSTPSITLDVYSHANEEAQRRANDVLAKAIYGNTTKHA